MLAAALPMAFFMAGAGMLWLYSFRIASGSFFERLLTHQNDWHGSHLLLFAGAILLVPAAIAMRAVVNAGRGIWLADTGLILVMICSFFLAGQYAIDFVMPLLANAGGNAVNVHAALFDSKLINILFYNLPDLCFIGLLLLTVALARAEILGRAQIITIFILWGAVLTGNILDYPLIGRGALFLLGFAMLPVSARLLKV
jgi:hypothetical protein